MIVLATGLARLKQDGDRVLLTVPSGADTIEVSLTLHQALGLAHAIPEVLNGAIHGGAIPEQTATVINLGEQKHKPLRSE